MDIVGESGNVKTRAFCPACGLPVYMTFAAAPDVLEWLRQGALPRQGVAHDLVEVLVAGRPSEGLA